MPYASAVFLAAVAVALAATPVVARVATRRGLLGVSRVPREGAPRPVPRLGGIAIQAATVVGLTVAAFVAGREDAWFFGGVALCGSLMFGVGLLDDLLGLSPAWKLAAQTVAAGVAYAWGFRIGQVTFGGEAGFDVGWFALPLTVLWIVAVTNAFNLIDGLDGLATGVAVVALASTSVAAGLLGNGEVLLVCLALGGALLGFLPYNLRPARIFLGDSGSMMVGFLLAVLSVHGSTKSATAVLAVVPLLVLALPLLDTAIAITRRWLRGVPVFGADERHLHHRLIAIGLTHRRAVAVLYVLAAGLAVCALVLGFAPPRVVVVTAVCGAVASVFLLLFGLNRLEYHEFMEAGHVMASVAVRVRRVIQDQIHARDVASVLRCAESLDHLRAILADNAHGLGFLSLELCHVGDEDRAPAGFPPVPAPGPWKLEYPVDVRGSAPTPWVLRLWCHQDNGFRLLGTERAVKILAEAIHAWTLADADRRAALELRPRGTHAAPWDDAPAQAAS